MSVSFTYGQKGLVKVIISTTDGSVGTVVAVIPHEYAFTVQNKYESLLNSSSMIASLSMGVNAIQSLTGIDVNASLVPYSPQIWMGSEPLVVDELELQFVAYKSALNDVHTPLMRLLAMSMPQRGGLLGKSLGIDVGMLRHPPAVTVTIGNVIKWSPCYIESCSVQENAPYDVNGYGYHGTARLSIKRRNYCFAEDFADNSQTTKEIAKPAGHGVKSKS